MPNPMSRNLAVVFVVGAIVGGLAIYLALSSQPKVAPPPTPPPTPLALGPCGQGTGHVVITTKHDKPFVDCQGVSLSYRDSVEWKKGDNVERFVVDFKSYAKPFKDMNGNKKGHFTEKAGDSSADADDPCPSIDYCSKYFPYSISVNGGPTYDPGVIITKP